MYAGVVVEEGPPGSLFAAPNHPYTRGLLASIPEANRSRGADGRRQRLTTIPGTVPSLHDLPPGCPFASRCSHVEDKCLEPTALASVSPGHLSRCWKMRERPRHD